MPFTSMPNIIAGTSLTPQAAIEQLKCHDLGQRAVQSENS